MFMDSYLTKDDAKQLAQEHGKDMVVVLHFDGRQAGYASYGSDRERCEMADEIGRSICDYLGIKLESNA